jgi:hypothetical protein
MQEVLLYRVYKQKRNQWDDPMDSLIYVLPITENRDSLLAYRYEVDRKNPSLSLFSSSPIDMNPQWFLEYHELVVDSNAVLRSMLDTLRDQVAEMNSNAVSMSAFYRRFRNVVEKSGAL